MQRVAHDEVVAREPLPHAVNAFPEQSQCAGPDKALQIPRAAHALHGDERQDIGLVQADACVLERIHGVRGEDDAQHDHQEKAAEERQHRQMPQYTFVPLMTVVKQKKNKVYAGHDLTEAVAQGEKGNVQPEARKKQAVPEFSRICPVELAPPGQLCLERSRNTLVFCHIPFPAQPCGKILKCCILIEHPCQFNKLTAPPGRLFFSPALTQSLQKE